MSRRLDVDVSVSIAKTQIRAAEEWKCPRIIVRSRTSPALPRAGITIAIVQGRRGPRGSCFCGRRHRASRSRERRNPVMLPSGKPLYNPGKRLAVGTGD